jgi:hypothetical protein
MNYNKIKMPSRNESNPVKNDPLSESIELIRSFALLEEDEDLMPVAKQEIERAIAVLEAIYAKEKLIPYFVVPTRSGGVGIEYKINDVKAYYRFDASGLMDFSVAKGNTILKQTRFINLDDAPNLLDLI